MPSALKGEEMKKIGSILVICCAIHSGVEGLGWDMLPDETCVAFSPADSHGDAAFNMALKHWRDEDGYLGCLWMMCATKRNNGAAQEWMSGFFNARAGIAYRRNHGPPQKNTWLLSHGACMHPAFNLGKSFCACERTADLLSFDDGDIRFTPDGAIYANAMFYKSASHRNWLVYRAIAGEREAALQLADYFGFYRCDIYLGTLWHLYALLLGRDCQDGWEMAWLCATSGFDYQQGRWTNECWKISCKDWLQETQQWYADIPKCASLRVRWGEWNNLISRHPWASEALQGGN